MLTGFSVIDRTAYGRKAERLPGALDLYELRDAKDLPKLSGVMRRNENGMVAIGFNGEIRQKMRAIMAMELQEVDSLGIHIVLPKSPHISVFRTFLDRVWGIDEPDSEVRSQSTIFTVGVPYHENLFRNLIVPAEYINVC